MPTTANRNAYMKQFMRQKRAKQKAAKATAPALGPAPVDPIGALAQWAEETLKIPAGHENAGQAMILPDYGLSFLRDAVQSREALLSVGRKNAKSAIIAVLILGYLVGPLRQDGFRVGIGSISKLKAGELKQQVQNIAEASGLQGLTFFRSPAPGRIESGTGGVDLLAADGQSGGGHAGGYDLILIDELGLIPESKREFIVSLRSSTSAKNGKIIALSIQGYSPFTKEIIERKNEPGVSVHHYAAKPDATVDDPQAWHDANPGIHGGIKSLAYMEHESRRVLSSVGDQSLFRAFDLNLPQDPAKQLIVDLEAWRKCIGEAERKGPRVVGFDLGGAAAMTSLVAYWIETGRVEAFAAFPSLPSLAERGKRDGCGLLYQTMYESGELWTMGRNTTDVSAFLSECMARLSGTRILCCGCDRFRKAEAVDFLEEAKVDFGNLILRGTGASSTADGSFDIRCFQRLILKGQWHTAKGGAILTEAISQASLRFDQGGNPALDKQKGNSRIDPLQAAVIAAGLAMPEIEKPVSRKARVLVVG